jgi:hypothetical protein
MAMARVEATRDLIRREVMGVPVRDTLRGATDCEASAV